MAKDDGTGEKTEPATPRKREESRERGQVAKSADLGAAVTLLLGFSTLKIMGPWLGAGLLAMFVYPLENLDAMWSSTDNVLAVGTQGTVGLALLLAPLLGVLLVAAALVCIVQVGFHISPKAFELNLERMNPVTGMQRIFGMRGAMKLVTGIAKIVIVGLVLMVVLSDELRHVMGFMEIFDYENNNIGQLVAYLLDTIIWLGIYAGATLTIIGIMDYSYQRWQHEQDIKMSKYEVKEEMKSMEGDPQIKRKRLERAREMAQRKMEKAVPQADVVVTNPTHYSCALRYYGSDVAPRLVAKGVDRLALRIREIATEHHVPIVEKPDLARALYRWVEVDDMVPEQYWGPVAEVLAFVYEKDKTRRERAMGASAGAPEKN